MEEVTILEASRRLNVSQDIIRSYVREGRLKARKQTGDEGRSWVVELPEEGWQDDNKNNIDSLAKQLTPWWWPNSHPNSRRFNVTWGINLGGLGVEGKVRRGRGPLGHVAALHDVAERGHYGSERCAHRCTEEPGQR